jgi:tRNA (cytidine32/uridine32-2'-O)-methyltransferase
MNLRFILHHPSHPGNIGAVARAIKVMGFSELHLIAPKKFPDPAATARASHATDILDQCNVHQQLKDSIHDLNVIIACTARPRNNKIAAETPNSMARIIQTKYKNQKIGILFGNEQNGLSNEELQHAQHIVTIPTNNVYSSLNLAQAVQIIAYELNIATTKQTFTKMESIDISDQHQRNNLISFCVNRLKNTTFFKNKCEDLSTQRLTSLIQRLNPSIKELNLLQAIFSYVATESTIKQSEEQINDLP